MGHGIGRQLSPELVDLSGFTPEQAYKQGEKLIEDLGLSEVVSLGNMYLNIVFLILLKLRR